MQRRSVVATGIVFILVMVLHALTVSTACGQAIPITQARQQPPGTMVTVAGSVTVPSGTFESATFDKGFAIEDETAGIYVSVSTDPELDFHQRVRVTGIVKDDGFGLLIIFVPPSVSGGVEVLPGAQKVDPQEVPICDLGENTEGSLVLVVGKVQPTPDDPSSVIRNDLPFGFGVFISDPNDDSCEIQVFIHDSSGINPFEIPFIQLGEQIEVTGFSGQFNQFVEVSPRIRGDLKKVK